MYDNGLEMMLSVHFVRERLGSAVQYRNAGISFIISSPLASPKAGLACSLRHMPLVQAVGMVPQTTYSFSTHSEYITACPACPVGECNLPPPPCSGQNFSTVRATVRGGPFLVRKPSAGHCVVTPNPKICSQSIPPISMVSAETCHTLVGTYTHATQKSLVQILLLAPFLALFLVFFLSMTPLQQWWSLAKLKQ